MASNVVVLHNNRRYVVKTTPSMLCREILVQACDKIGIKSIDNLGLKNGKSNVDLSLPVRLANLAAGAKLDIYKIGASEAMKPITLALQCSDPPIRLTGTFPPTATLTEVLLHFEQESEGKLVVFGRKGQEAVLSVLGREFGISEGPGGGGGTTLAGMGVGGNVLVRLGFRLAPTSASLTPTPSASSSASNRVPVSLPPSEPARVSSPPQQPQQPLTQTVQQQQAPTPPAQLAPSSPPAPQNISLQASSSSSQSPPPPTPSPPESPLPPPPTAGPGNRQRVVYSAASGSTPIAAKLEHDESAYNMTTEQAKGYQAYLSAATKSQSEKVLMTREMREAAERERTAKRAFQECHVRIRFPDATQVQGTFNSDETVADIYGFVRDQISSHQPFQLHLLPNGLLADSAVRILEAGFSHRTQLIFHWENPVSGKVLKDDVLNEAVDIERHASTLLGDQAPSKGKGKGKGNEGSGEGPLKKMPKWLGKLTKK